jgi:hypothetical protein
VSPRDLVFIWDAGGQHLGAKGCFMGRNSAAVGSFTAMIAIAVTPGRASGHQGNALREADATPRYAGPGESYSDVILRLVELETG